MPNSPEQSQAYNDEIDLADLIRALWQGKWLVIGVTLATLALGIAYLMIAPKSYTASLNILALPNSQADVYIELHEAQLIATDKQSLLALFVEDLTNPNPKCQWLGTFYSLCYSYSIALELLNSSPRSTD